MNNNYFFILGASDPEMHEIERVLTEQGLPFAYAKTRRFSRVEPSTAYMATNLSAPFPKDATIVMVECGVIDLRCDVLIDHHHAGDPGFGKTPEDFMQGSSLAQLLTLLKLEPTQEQRVICAADHCLTAAYRGECPGVLSEQVAEFRLRSRSINRGVTPELLHTQIEAARAMLEAAPRISLGGTDVAWIARADDIPELSEASARFGIPYMYRRRENRYSETLKAGIRGAAPSVIREWMKSCNLNDVYGDPDRGFAGGYLFS